MVKTCMQIFWDGGDGGGARHITRSVPVYV